MTEIEKANLRLECLKLAAQLDPYNATSAAKRFYNWIIDAKVEIKGNDLDLVLSRFRDRGDSNITPDRKG